jgi:hypothetical protein
MAEKRRERQDTLPLLTSGQSSARKWLEWIQQMGDVNMLLLIAKALNEREDAVLPSLDTKSVEIEYSREDLIEFALRKVIETTISRPHKLLKRLIPFKAYDIKLELIDRIISEPLDNRDDRTVSGLLRLAEFLADNPDYLPTDIQFKKIGEAIKRLQSLEGVAEVISGEVRGNVERVS